MRWPDAYGYALRIKKANRPRWRTSVLASSPADSAAQNTHSPDPPAAPLTYFIRHGAQSWSIVREGERTCRAQAALTRCDPAGPRSRHQVERSLERRQRRQEARRGLKPQLIREQVAQRETVSGVDDLWLAGNACELPGRVDGVVQAAQFVNHLERARLLARVDPSVRESEHGFSVQAASLGDG